MNRTTYMVIESTYDNKYEDIQLTKKGRRQKLPANISVVNRYLLSVFLINQQAVIIKNYNTEKIRKGRQK